ncbi:archaeal proteasome endopeptidase complex subunit beta [Halorussus amylolyticus]|uniref:archaeal proteasome endopeptidase complex subunit beta n=1 Tax=Halorussus amylolyticus TaxID=1126242 RepID=UPI001047DCEA|nr:archaeal proteasome endopeptidase complex subunit beta [Halorussus amylolyticus]
MRNPMHGSEFSQNTARLATDGPNPYEPELGSLPDRSVDTSDVEQLKTGTTTVGLTTTDGVVMVTDKRASLGNMVSSKTAQKVEQIHPNGALTIAGGVSAAQSLIRTLEVENNLYEARRGEDMSMEALSTLTANLLRSGAFLIVVPILGGVDEEGGHVYSFDALGGVTEETYTVSGSGSQFALGVLEQDYHEDIGQDEAREVAVRALKSAVERDTASGNGMWLAEMTGDGVGISEYDDYDDAL